MPKPTFDELMKEVEKPNGKYTREIIEVEVFRERDQPNVYFVPDDEDCVLDGFVVLTDVNGVVFSTRKKSFAENLSAMLRKGAAGILGMFGKVGIPAGVLSAIIQVVSGRSQKAARVVEALGRAQQPGGLPQAVVELLWVLGPKKFRRSMGTLKDNLNTLPPEMALKAIEEAALDKAKKELERAIEKL